MATTNDAAGGQLHAAGDIGETIERKQKDLPGEARRQGRRKKAPGKTGGGQGAQKRPEEAQALIGDRG